MIIRAEQLKAFAKTVEERFEDQLVLRLHDLFPHISSKLSETGLREVIQYGMIQARRYGIVRERDVGRYIGIMLMLVRILMPRQAPVRYTQFCGILMWPVLACGLMPSAKLL